MRTVCRGFAILVAILTGAVPTAVQAGAGQARQQVKSGLERFQAGDLEGAEKAFADADVALPEDSRVAFDRACVLAAKGDADKALELFRKAALSRDPAVVASAHYNLGGVMVGKAKAAFGAEPEAAQPEARQAGLQALVAAIGHYRDCLKIDPAHAQARGNLEVLRLWIKHMQDVWAKRDREQRRQDQDALAMLQMIETEQTQLRQQVRSSAAEPDSPRRRQAIRQTHKAQVDLAEEIEPLKEKLKAVVQPPAPAAGAAPAPAPAPPDPQQVEKIMGVLNDLTDRSHTAMVKAGLQLEKQELDQARASQATALEALNEIYRGLAPFQNLLQKATGTEQDLVNQSQEFVDAQKADPKTEPKLDVDEAARRQTLVTSWSEVLPRKAEQELKQLEADPAAKSAPGPQPAPAPDPKQEEAKAGLRQALQKAVELSPKIQELSQNATDELKKKTLAAALTKQEEALKLLQEIAASLPKQEPPPEQNQDQQNQPQKQGQPPQAEPPKNDQKDGAKKPPQQNPSQQQAEAALRKVRQRDREHRERQKQLQGNVSGGEPRGKDW